MTATVEIIWDTHNEYIIRDVNEKWHDRVRKYMLEKYFKPHRLYNHLNFQDDPDTNNQYLKYVDHILRDECSIVVLHAQTGDIFGVALLKCMIETLKSWTCLQYCMDGSPFMDVVDLQYRTIFEYGVDYPNNVFNNLHLFEYYIENNLRNDFEFVGKFFKAIFNTARCMKMERVTCLALSFAEQKDCFEQGFERVGRTIYSLFVVGKNCRPFSPLRLINESEAGLFAIPIKRLIPYTTIIVRGLEAAMPQRKKSINIA